MKVRSLRQGERRDVEATADDVPLDEEAQFRFDRLRTARLKIAREKGLPPYVVCHDKTLRQIALSQPQTLEQLETVKGMGPMKVQMYGQAMLDAMSA